MTVGSIDVQPSRDRFSREMIVAINGVAVSLAVAMAGWLAAGSSFGTILWISAMLPLVALFCVRQAASDIWLTVIRTAVSISGCAVLIVVGTVGEMVQCVVAIYCSALALIGIRNVVSRWVGSGVGRLLIGLAWLIWWTMPLRIVQERYVAVLSFHPLMAMNAIASDLGDWSHQPIAYVWLTRLGQDVPAGLPLHWWAAALLHGGVGIAALYLHCAIVRRTAVGFGRSRVDVDNASIYLGAKDK